jgi:hypothetical protein
MPVLAREHSDFAWFKARAESLQFDLTAGQSKMANVDEHGLLNAETSQPGERAEHDLPPKSYAEAIIQPLEEQENANKHVVEINGNSSTPSNTAAKANGTRSTNGAEKHLDTPKVVYSQHVDARGTAVASVEPEPGYEAALQHNHAPAPRQRRETAFEKTSSPGKAKLASGRKAGAGWGRSAYVYSSVLLARC